MLHCLKGCRGNTEFASSLAKSIKTRFASYEFDEVATLAMFLDPHFKATVHQASDQVIWLKDLVSSQLQSSDMAHGTDTAVPATTSRPLVASSVWNAFDYRVMNKEKTQTESAPQREIMEYAEQPLLETGNDPCEWWRSIKPLGVSVREHTRPEVLDHPCHLSSQRNSLFHWWKCCHTT
ncbi:hypothetical protein HPB48_009987 [Haemaphysalis longicornis]|uniref:Uncharacterized protein n=1 Tax=Haemaphysalis longicornis TaxID=44386 RepID=A0A9J6FYR0_HAELO|nr:hypothetical protein HPB48_009987 [Haemaphysalis longicornis]